jgi:hypothetical protein
MRLPPPPLACLCALALLAGLACIAYGPGTPTISPAQAALYEGQGPVHVAGLADQLSLRDGGASHLQVHGDGGALDLAVQAEVHAADGDWVEARGRIGRSAGRLTLFVASAADIRTLPGPEPAQVPWRALAEDPASWSHRPLRLSGWVERGALRDHDGHSVQLGNGAWPAKGAVRAAGFVAYDPGCLCHRFHARQVETLEAKPWTP